MLARELSERLTIQELGGLDFYWNQLSRDAMSSLLECAAQDGWRAGLRILEEHYAPDEAAGMARYIAGRGRSRALMTSRAGATSFVVDLGCGWGALGLELAPRVGHVAMLDATLPTLEFVRIRATQEGLDNVSLAHVPPFGTSPLPFADGSVDLVVVNGVLEWVGLSCPDARPEQTQMRFLADCARVLRTGGQLYLGIENRWFYKYLLGVAPHDEPRFAGLLPRVVLRGMERASGRAILTRIHSLRTLRRMLVAVGLAPCSASWLRPDYRHPDSVIPLDDASLVNAWAAAVVPSRVKRMLAPVARLPLVRDLAVHSLGLVAEKVS